MSRINVVVEGQTEEAFVTQVLAPYLGAQGVFLTPRRAYTSKRGTKYHRGGVTTYSLVKRDIVTWLRQDQGAWVTTMLDLYRLPDDFPGHLTTSSSQDPYVIASALEAALAQDISSLRFIPYIQLHEFEAYLFSDVSAIASYFFECEGLRDNLSAIRDGYHSPEHINSRPGQAPSKRLMLHVPAYDALKRIAGPVIAEKIGLAVIRKECLHFNSWIERMVAVTQKPSGTR